MDFLNWRFTRAKGTAVGVIVCMATLVLLYRTRKAEDDSILDGTLYACTTLPGRLGNHIFHYASVYGLARKYNLTVLLAKDDEIVRYFKLPSAKLINNREMCSYFEVKRDKFCCTFDESFLHLDRKSYRFEKYLQSWKYFRDMFPGVRSEFEFKDGIKAYAHDVVEDFRHAHMRQHELEEVTVVGIHVRRGDIVTDKAMKAFIMVPDSYVYRAIDYMVKKYKNVIFVVCSDDIRYVQRLVDYKNVTAIYKNTSPIQDIAILASCDHVIMTYGTFGWWSGFLSGGEVVYYAYPFTEYSIVSKSYNYEDFYPPNWIGIQ